MFPTSRLLGRCPPCAATYLLLRRSARLVTCLSRSLTVASKHTQASQGLANPHRLSQPPLLLPAPPPLRVPCRRNHADGDERSPVPKLLYLHNPLRWLRNKVDFTKLRLNWDEDFDEAEFIRGSKQAMSVVSQHVAAGRFRELDGLLTRSAQILLRSDMETMWLGQMRREIAVKPEDIQLAVPRKVHFTTFRDQRFCNIDMVFIALKWADIGRDNVIAYLEMIARFNREYTEGFTPNWTIALFRVTKYKLSE